MGKKRKEKEIALYYRITGSGVRSIEELAKLGMPFDILSRTQKIWLLRGGLEYFKEERPYLYPLVERMVENRDRVLPEGVTLKDIGEEVAKRLGKEGKERDSIISLVFRIIRWIVEPYFVKSENVREIARTLRDVLKEKYEKDPEGYKYLYKSVSEWVKWHERVEIFRKGCKDG